MAASTTDKLTNTASTTTTRPQATQVTSSRSAGVFTLACNSLTGWPTDTKVHFCTYKLTTAGAKIAGSQIDMDGIVSGTSIGSITIRGGSDVGNAIGDIVEMAPTAAWGYDLNKWGTGHANPDGSLLTAAVQAALGLTSLNGYTPLGFTPNSVAANGNNIYTLTFNTQDLTGILSANMRIRTTRTVVAPTQCFNANGTTQFYSKTSPAGMTFTNNFVVSAWIKVNATGTNGTIASRYNGTSGWQLYMLSGGQLVLVGYNAGAANYSQVVSSQTVPTGKWVHVAAQLDMATFTASPTTSYIMIDGADVPATVSRAGTNPTALIQAGNLEIGSLNGGTQLFAGKIAQVAVYSAKVTEATVLASSAQGLLGTETSLISAYSFSNTINDLNTTNANNLTASGSAVATNADSPFGNGGVSTTLDYAEITSVSFSTNTTVVVTTPTANTIPTSGGVAAVVYSSNYEPYGYPTIGAVRSVSLYNPYKFRAWLSAATNFGTTATVTPFDSKLFDTSGNLDIVTNKGRFTAPVAGYYQFNARVSTSQGSGVHRVLLYLYKNGAVYSRGSDVFAGFFNGSQISDVIQLNAGEYVDCRPLADTVIAYDAGGQDTNYFSGFLISAV